MAIRRLERICPWWPLLSQNRAPKVKVSQEWENHSASQSGAMFVTNKSPKSMNALLRKK